ncbi:MAG: aromatic ring-hydroxylating dioxygenase subunit alpha [Rhodospirillaceae bacterium]|jgi:phenylpropionate dioxygenase-like ring-hydroxylating dioxygenase large terminal subunit|nr:aromatic ring-hydroxylating dioxygenase subunit alpha [Rhodospirillaceae bacterium]MBT4588863.1 aromatic ring-hydroxylating dioxygenase subunit alpha [Rhodospirillaceae bacterium]MBT7269004.1 aromatic ring-hydroxylating dioxygenase subunit alpha [Rhodospirillaceae bacterium]
MYLRNTWYVGAWAHEVTREPFQRFMLDEPLVFYRTEAGDPVVMDDRCCHRFAPLSSGWLEGDDIVCGYHGFTFDPSGKCIAVPGLDKAPKKAVQNSYPVIEKWGWIFVWMGDAELADESKVPDFHYMDDPEWAGRGTTLHIEAAYNLIYENLLDLTHAKYVHKTTLATDDVTDHPLIVEEVDDTVVVRRDMIGIEKTSPFFNHCAGFTQPVDHTQHITFTPATYIMINTRVQSAAGTTENKFAEFRVINALTPEKAGSTHYFWNLRRNFALEDDELDEWIFNGNSGAFAEDKVIIELQQQMWDTVPESRPVPFPHDKGVIYSEKLMARLIEAEQSAKNLAAE